MTARMPVGGQAVLERDMTTFAGLAGMNVSAVETDYEDSRPTTWVILLQSPQASAVIYVESTANVANVRFRMERTCITDDLEDWHPYWSKLRKFMADNGYGLVDAKQPPE